MERMEKKSLLFLLVVLQICSIRSNSCSNQKQDQDLTCYTDYDHNITCVWNSTNDFGRTDATCELHGRRINPNTASRAYSAHCVMEPGPEQRTCSLDFNKPGNFQIFHRLNITLKCGHTEPYVTMLFNPSCHIKLHPPAKPHINFTTVSWFSQVKKHIEIGNFNCELQWKRWDQEWKNTKTTSCKWNCMAELDPDLLVEGQTYKARVRVRANEKWSGSVWSEWSPTSSWVSPIGEAEPALPTMLTDFTWGKLGMVIVGAATALVLGSILFKNDKVTWVYKKIKGYPPPDPAKSFLKDPSFKGWWSPHFTTMSLDSTLNKEEIVPVQIISSADAVQVCSKDAALLEKTRSERSFKSNRASFSNPIYPHLCTSSPKASPSSGTRKQSDFDEARVRKDDEEDRVKELTIRQLLSCSHRSEVVQVVSDYEKVEKRDSGQGLDSVGCTGGQLSQDSLEAECVSAADEDSDEAAREAKDKAHETDAVFQKLFGVGVGNVFGTGSVTVCSDYEKIQKLEPSSPELPSLDSGVSCEGEDEEQLSREESPEDLDLSGESTKVLSSTPLLPSVLPTPIFTFPQGALKCNPSGFFPTSGLSDIKWRLDLTSVPKSTEPSGDGYMPVKQQVK